MDRFHAMTVFSAVADKRSFAGAARELAMSRPAVSRAIAFLEDTVGVELLVRTTRNVALTQAGARYLEDCRAILEAVAEADAALLDRVKTPTGELKLTAPAMFGRMHVLPIVADYLAANAGVRVHTMLLDRVVNLAEEGVELGVRIGHLEDSSQVAIRVGEVVRVTVASPAYLARAGTPLHPDELTTHRVIGHVHDGAATAWRYPGQRVALEPVFSVNDTRGCVEMARRGLGITRPLSYQVGEDLLSGRLVRLLEDHEPPHIPVHLIHRGGPRLPARIRAFLDLAAPRLRARSAAGWPTA